MDKTIIEKYVKNYIKFLTSYINQLDKYYNLNDEMSISSVRSVDIDNEIFYTITIYSKILYNFIQVNNLTDNFNDMIDIDNNVMITSTYEVIIDNILTEYNIDTSVELEMKDGIFIITFPYINAYTIDSTFPILPNNTWIGITSKIKLIDMVDYSDKPGGMYFSKGDWLYHDIFISDDYRKKSTQTFDLVQINTDNIIFLKSYTDLANFNKRYVTNNRYEIINWSEIKKEYYGLHISDELARYTQAKGVKHGWTHGYDIETLIIWKDNAIIKKNTFSRNIYIVSDDDISFDLNFTDNFIDTHQMTLLIKDIKHVVVEYEYK